MHVQQIFSFFVSLAIVEAALTSRKPVRGRARPIEWTACGSISGMNIECGTLTVPLDYQSPTAKATFDLVLRKMPAVNSPSKESILLNYGGPGLSGLEGFTFFGPQQMK